MVRTSLANRIAGWTVFGGLAFVIVVAGIWTLSLVAAFLSLAAGGGLGLAAWWMHRYEVTWDDATITVRSLRVHTIDRASITHVSGTVMDGPHGLRVYTRAGHTTIALSLFSRRDRQRILGLVVNEAARARPGQRPESRKR